MLYPHQAKAIEFLSSHNSAALYLDCGAGKTRILLETISLLRIKEPTLKCLIIAPIRVLYMVWPYEIKKWSYDLSYLNLHESKYKEGFDVYLINPHRLQTKNYELPDADILIIDESTYFKNHSSKRFKRLKGQIDKYRYRYILSGTPAPRSYENLWPQYYLLDEGKRLGKNISKFRRNYFLQDPYFYYYSLRKGSEKRIEDKVKDITYRINTENTQEPIYDNVYIHISHQLKAKIKQFTKNGYIEINGDELITQSQIATRAKLRQLASGFLYGHEKESIEVHSQKIAALLDLIDSLQGKNLIVVYNYKKELELLESSLKLSSLSSATSKMTKTIDSWNKGEIYTLALQPQSCGHGLNLQHGGHHICWFSPTLDLELYLQTNARIIRPGQKNQVYIHHLVTKDSIEEKIYGNLQMKKDSLDGLLKAMTNDIQ